MSFNNNNLNKQQTDRLCELLSRGRCALNVSSPNYSKKELRSTALNNICCLFNTKMSSLRAILPNT